MKTSLPAKATLCIADLEAVRAKIGCWRTVRPHDAEDILSDALYAWVRRAEIEAIRNPQAWLLRAAQLYTRNHRRRSRSPKCLIEGTDSRPGAPPSGDSSVRETVCEVLAGLPHNHRRIVELCDLQQLTVAGAARELGVSRSTAKSWRSRAHKSLGKNPRLIALAIKEFKS